MIEGQEGVTWEEWLALAHATEAAGLGGLFRSDHYGSIVRGEPAGALDAWAILAALAARTERIRLGTMVSPVTFRPPSVLAKNVVTVDHVSGGRVELGIGAGLVRGGTRDLRVPLRDAARRGSTSWIASSTRSRASGRRPGTSGLRPLQQPRPPIIVGGRAKPRTVAAAIRHADEYNTTFPSVEEARERASVVVDAARAAGRAPLRFSMMTGCVVGRDAAEVRERLGGVAGRHAERRRAAELAGRSTRLPRACATTRPRASSGRCSSTSSTRTSRWSRSSVRSPCRSPPSLLRPASACYHGGSDGMTFMRGAVGLAAILGVALFVVASTSASDTGARSGPGPAEFVRVVDNQWFPLRPGTVFRVPRREGRRADPRRRPRHDSARGRIHRAPLHRGVADRLYSARIRLSRSGRPTGTRRTGGTVWYFGEETAELDRPGKVTSREGSWLAGVDGARVRGSSAGPAVAPVRRSGQESPEGPCG